MSQNIAEVLSRFSQKLARFSKSPDAERVVPLSKDSYYAERLRERGERLREAVVATYKIYRAPIEALGERSDRAASLDKDERNLLKAYNLYKSCMEIDKENQDEIGATYIRSVEIASPLADKAAYTSGGQLVYLIAWLFFEQRSEEYVPYFEESGSHGAHFSLAFARADSFSFDARDKEILDIIRAEFYS